MALFGGQLRWGQAKVDSPHLLHHKRTPGVPRSFLQWSRVTQRHHGGGMGWKEAAEKVLAGSGAPTGPWGSPALLRPSAPGPSRLEAAACSPSCESQERTHCDFLLGASQAWEGPEGAFGSCLLPFLLPLPSPPLPCPLLSWHVRHGMALWEPGNEDK